MEINKTKRQILLCSLLINGFCALLFAEGFSFPSAGESAPEAASARTLSLFHHRNLHSLRNVYFDISFVFPALKTVATLSL